MNKLYVMCGIPASGKSTFCIMKCSKEKNSKWVSRDTIRFSLLEPNDTYFAKESQVYREFTKQINNYLAEGYDVYADATHLNPLSRAKLFRTLNINKAKTQVIALVMQTPQEECIYRNELRKGTKTYVPRHSLDSMIYNFMPPTLDEYGGIIDKIINVQAKN